MVGVQAIGDIREADTGRDVMIEWVDFTHPLFRPLADPRFNDFAKIRFWHHRQWTGLDAHADLSEIRGQHTCDR